MKAAAGPQVANKANSFRIEPSLGGKGRRAKMIGRNLVKMPEKAKSG
jgi:hypothetical protein